jgi:hypothetical protein
MYSSCMCVCLHLCCMHIYMQEISCDVVHVSYVDRSGTRLCQAGWELLCWGDEILTFSWWPLMKAKSEQIVSTFIFMYVCVCVCVCVCVLLCIFKGRSCHRARVLKVKRPTSSSWQIIFILIEHHPLFKQIPMYSWILKQKKVLNKQLN